MFKSFKNSLFASDIFQYFILAILLILILFVWIHHFIKPHKIAGVGVTVIATPAKEIKLIPVHQAPVKNGTVRVYASPAKIKLDLPKLVVDDEQKQVVASTTVQGDDHPQTTTTTVNLETGEFDTFTKKEPLPWLAWDDKGSAGLYTGIKRGGLVARLELKQNIFSVKSVHVGAVATLDQPISSAAGLQTDYFIGVGAEYRW
jgi:hypothetical protein